MEGFLKESSMEFDLYLEKLNHILESRKDIFNIRCAEIDIQSAMLESYNSDIVLEAASSSLSKSVSEFITKIIDMLREYISKLTKAINKYFEEKQAKKMYAQLKKHEADVMKAKNELAMLNPEYKKKLLDEYLREMLQLERELLTLKTAHKGMTKVVDDGTFVVEVNKIMRKVDELNAKYDKAFLDDSKDIISMASKDAIRFSEKQLENVRVDYDALENGSSKILQQFKIDANGCEVPVKLNCLQKMTNSVATRVRKTSDTMTSYKKKNFATVATVIAAVAVGTGYVLYKAGDPKVTTAVNFAKGKADEIKQIGVDYVNDLKNL